MQATKYIRNPYEKFMLAIITMLIKGMKNPGLCRGFPIRRSDCGGGGSRTLVQTRNQKAFYTLSRPFILLFASGRRRPNAKPSP